MIQEKDLSSETVMGADPQKFRKCPPVSFLRSFLSLFDLSPFLSACTIVSGFEMRQVMWVCPLLKSSFDYSPNVRPAFAKKITGIEMPIPCSTNHHLGDSE